MSITKYGSLGINVDDLTIETPRIITYGSIGINIDDLILQTPNVISYGSLGINVDDDTLKTPNVISYGSLGINVDDLTLKMLLELESSGIIGISIDEANMTIPIPQEITISQSFMMIIFLVMSMWLMKEIIDMFSDLME